MAKIKYTYDFVKKYIESFDGYRLISLEKEYKNSSSKIKIMCPESHEYEVTFQCFLKGTRCRKCFDKRIKDFTSNDYEDIKEYIKSLDYTLISDNYISAKNKLRIKCNKHNHIFEMSWHELKNKNKKCPICKPLKFKKYTIDEIKKYANENNYNVLSDVYINSQEKLLFLCPQNHKFYMNFTSFKQGQRCPYCYGNIRKTTESFKKEVYDLARDEFLVIGEYINSKTKIKMLHNIDNCMSIFEVTPNDFLNKNSRCAKCSGIKKKNTEDFSREILLLTNSEYQVLSNYYNNKTRVEMLHVKCGTKFCVKPNSFLNSNSRCPKCNYSSGESAIDIILNKYNINFKRQYRISDCKNIYPLPFDFAVFDNNDNLLFLIEFDGIQHFYPSFGDEPYKATRRNDKIKNQYCKKYNIDLLRINYKQFNDIENILLNKLNLYNLINKLN